MLTQPLCPTHNFDGFLIRESESSLSPPSMYITWQPLNFLIHPATCLIVYCVAWLVYGGVMQDLLPSSHQFPQPLSFHQLRTMKSQNTAIICLYLRSCPHLTCAVFQLALTANFCKTLITTIRWKCLNSIVNLKILQLREVAHSSESERVRWDDQLLYRYDTVHTKPKQTEGLWGEMYYERTTRTEDYQQYICIILQNL
jgi:hypothetical protein